ncbi:hypothetical protein [Paenibacillus rhizophilus]|uniref:Uncharacterized protein n=1 Tax=Paenibacillus rhizophilus TaxID=1850366 RepID=A0A3N9Q7D1_9BACL|nr:hypothetical protein [Paenibacillus rhizophilus]RQW13426.1 hypothetical protein EH198_03105 [Paenibacillus rhizophilus]
MMAWIRRQREIKELRKEVLKLEESAREAFSHWYQLVERKPCLDILEANTKEALQELWRDLKAAGTNRDLGFVARLSKACT